MVMYINGLVLVINVVEGKCILFCDGILFLDVIVPRTIYLIFDI